MSSNSCSTTALSAWVCPAMVVVAVAVVVAAAVVVICDRFTGEAAEDRDTGREGDFCLTDLAGADRLRLSSAPAAAAAAGGGGRHKTCRVEALTALNCRSRLSCNRLARSADNADSAVCVGRVGATRMSVSSPLMPVPPSTSPSSNTVVAASAQELGKGWSRSVV